MDHVEYPDGHPSPVMEFIFIDNYQVHHPEKASLSNNNTFINEKNRIIKNRKVYYEVNPTTLGPFDYDDEAVTQFLNDVVAFKVNYTFQTHVPHYYEDNLECYKWLITQNFNFESRGHFTSFIITDTHTCDENLLVISGTSNFINKLIWIHMIVLFLAIISLIFTYQKVSLLAKLYVDSKLNLKKGSSS